MFESKLVAVLKDQLNSQCPRKEKFRVKGCGSAWDSSELMSCPLSSVSSMSTEQGEIKLYTSLLVKNKLPGFSPCPWGKGGGLSLPL